MTSNPKPNRTTWHRWVPLVFCLPVVVGAIGFLLCIAIPEWQEVAARRARRAQLDPQIADVSDGKTTSIRFSDLATLNDVVENPELADELRHLPQLKTIHIEYTAWWCDDFLECVQGMESLEELTFHRAAPSPKGMPWLGTFPKLRRLACDQLAITNGILEQLAALHGLEELDLRGGPYGAEQVEKVRKALPKCKINADAVKTTRETQ
jgi:hypothetical protein